VALRLDDKKAIVAEVKELAEASISALAANYRSLTVSEMNVLRSKAKESKVNVRVVRNTLAKRAFEGTKFECMRDSLVGPLVLAFSQEEPSAAARLFRDFVKDHEALEVTSLSLEGKVLPGSELKAVASLPNRDEAISMLMSVMQAPISKFVRTLAEPHTQMVRAFAAVAGSKEQAA
jgi:large subunit ribosomal protein L10